MCEALTLRGHKCKNKAKPGTNTCATHTRTLVTLTKKFLGRLGTLIHDAAEDLINRLPRHETPVLPDVKHDECYYCKEALTKHTRSRDHVVRMITNCRINPLTNLSNVTVPCCKSCNSRQIGQKNPVFTDADITVRYEFEYEDELNEIFDQIRVLLERGQKLINTGRIIELPNESPKVRLVLVYPGCDQEGDEGLHVLRVKLAAV
jgi:hypothetical protein